MVEVLTRSASSAIREAARGLAAARDAQIMQVVAMVDAMPNRGSADQLIAPPRRRLGWLRPPRPSRFARLLFLPLDPLIVPAARWRADEPTIPRSVISVLAAATEAALGRTVQQGIGRTLKALTEGRTTEDTAAVDVAGAMLSGRAGAWLRESPVPDGWGSTGLSAQVYQSLSRRIGALLEQAERLRRMTEDAAHGMASGSQRRAGVADRRDRS